jgi:hypothetical protein
MLFKDQGSQYIENLKMRDGWFMVKTIYYNNSLTNGADKRKHFFKEEVGIKKYFNYSLFKLFSIYLL